MEIIKHRVNAVLEIDSRFGSEIDIRDYNNDLVLSHDNPSRENITLREFLKKIDMNKILAINAKTSEIEKELYQIIQKTGIKNYFTFDWSIPALLKALNTKLVCAYRLSEYEKDRYSNCQWVWLDAFHSIWYDKSLTSSLKDEGYKVAIVSPELHGRKKELNKVKEIVKSGTVDAICTDLPEYWLDDKSNTV